MQGKLKKLWLRIVLFIAGFAGVFIFLYPFVTKGIKNIGNLTGVVLGICLILYAVWFHRVNHRVKKWLTRTTGKVICGIVLLIVVIAVGFAAAGTICMVRASKTAPKDETVMIVLGCGVNGDRPSLMLTERLDAAYDYLNTHEEVVGILSGGQGKGENISEAECMYRYLTEKGIAKERLYKEERSTSTRENLLYSKKIMEEEHLDFRVIIVTNEFHEYRASVIAEHTGITPSAVCGKTAWWLLPTYYLRELYGIVFEWIF